MSRAQSGQPSVLQELLLIGCSALLSMIVLNFGLKRLDPNRQTSKAAIERKKELASRLGRPNLDTNVYEKLSMNWAPTNILTQQEVTNHFDGIAITKIFFGSKA